MTNAMSKMLKNNHHAFRLVQIIGTYMQPTLKDGDFVIGVPVGCYAWEGLYSLDLSGSVGVYRCQHVGGKRIKVSPDDPVHSPTFLSIDEFNERVLLAICGEVRVTNPVLIEIALGRHAS